MMYSNRFFKTTIITLTLTLLAATSYAFDGKRKGFVAGFGVGFAPVAHWSSNYPDLHATASGYGANILVGYAWDDRNMLVYEGNGCMHNDDELDSHWAMQSLDAVRWYHYWGTKNRYFACVGLGYMIFETEYCNIDGRGFGYSAGVGYELFKQVQVGLYFNGGHTESDALDFTVKANHAMLNLLVTVVAY